MPVILVTQEAEIRRIAVRSQPGQIGLKTLSQKTFHVFLWTGGVSQGEGLVFKPQYRKKKKKERYLQSSNQVKLMFRDTYVCGKILL
jgi:hypothetical protein